MQELKYKDIVKALLETISAFKKSDEYDSENEEITYLLFSDFARFLTSKIERAKNPEQDEDIAKSFSFLENMLNADDKEVVNLAEVEILEQLAQSSKATEFTKRVLSEKARINFERIISYWGTNGKQGRSQ